MTKRRISRKAGRARTKNLSRGPRGYYLCRYCGEEVAPPRKTFCSDACVHEHKIRTQPAYVRRCLFDRDRGVCALCGTDTVVLEQRLAIRIAKAKQAAQGARTAGERSRLQALYKKRVAAFLERLGAPLGRRRTAGYWDADHTKPVVLGGGECGLDGYRTLCLLCHRQETAKLRKKLKER